MIFCSLLSKPSHSEQGEAGMRGGGTVYPRPRSLAPAEPKAQLYPCQPEGVIKLCRLNRASSL